MATFTVTTGSGDPDDGLTLREAIELAKGRAGEDKIRFADGVREVVHSEQFQITAEGGPVIIDGDHDGDGISDVVIRADSGKNFTIAEGGNLTLCNVDLIGGTEEVGGIGFPYGTWGTGGSDSPEIPFEGHDGADGDEGGAGEDGGNAIEQARSSAASILNFGALTLERVGFGDVSSSGQKGATGGTGGFGGVSRGGDGEVDDNAATIPVPFNAASFKYSCGPVENSGAEPFAGDGGDGGTGGRGGDGGTGGTGGDASVIENHGTLTLLDVAFGGRLPSGEIVVLGDIVGGTGGFGGRGGSGGASVGGDGADGGIEWESYDIVTWSPTGDPRDVIDGAPAYFFHKPYWSYVTTGGGDGGDGGRGGSGGNSGTGGIGGTATFVRNSGEISGAFAGDLGDLKAGNGGFGGEGGVGGDSSGGTGGVDQRPSYSVWGVGGSGDEFLRGGGATAGTTGFDPEPLWAFLEGGYSHVYTSEDVPDIDPEKTGADGVVGAVGADGSGGAGGDAGDREAVLSVGGSGVADVAKGLVYVYGGGEVSEGTDLAFTIARIGVIEDEASVSWQLKGRDGSSVSAEDFGAPTSGTVTLAPGDADGNAARILIPVLADGFSEGGEGWKVVLTDVSGRNVTLGTSEIAGTVIDGGSPPTSGDTPTEGDDDLKGTRKADRINALGGDDTVKGLGGKDVLKGGRGSDTLDGGSGNDKLIGGSGADLLKGGKGDDRLEGGGGNDVLKAKGGTDILDGGKGNDRLFGDAGNDRLLGGAGNDLLKDRKGDNILKGDAGRDRLISGKGDDRLEGGGGNDVLKAKGGADILDGGKGDDVLIGGGGADVFVFGRKHGIDTIRDFDPGRDKIDLSGLKLDYDDLRISRVGGDTLIDTGAGEIHLDGVLPKHLDPGDFLF